MTKKEALTRIKNHNHGKRLDLREANLTRANLTRANLTRANLTGADLAEANLTGANLTGADLAEAYLAEANLTGAYLAEANLTEAYLAEANLTGAYLAEANLTGANLTRANLARANLTRANLVATILDPSLLTNGGSGNWTDTGGGEVFGYRTRRSTNIGNVIYEDGEAYEAPVFSVCPITDCHPGLYVWPTFTEAQDWKPGIEIIKVKLMRANNLHSAGGKHRCRKFTVIGGVTE